MPSRPTRSRRYESLGYRAKRVLLGPALRTSQLMHERITKRVALAVFSSDDLLHRLCHRGDPAGPGVRGAAATGLALPISVAIAGLLGILVLSYRQIIKAYSSSGGAYVVSRDNFGGLVASIAGSALIIDYILTVAVSVSAGTAALTSAFRPGAVAGADRGRLRGLVGLGQPARPARVGADLRRPHLPVRAGMAVVVLWDLAVGGRRPGPDQLCPSRDAPAGRLRRGAGPGDAVPHPAFFLGWGDRADRGGGDLQRGLGVQEPRNARTTLVGMAAIMAFLFIGITFLATRFDARPFADGNPTLVAQLARHVLDNPAAFIAIQVATLLILVLAANTSFSSFPLLASFAADDAILPASSASGHRLVYSNGILVLSAAAVFLVIAFGPTPTTSSRCTPSAWSPPSPCPRRAWPAASAPA